MIDIILVSNKTEDQLKKNIIQIKENTPEDYNLILTGTPFSASKNRNIGLAKVKSGIFIMLDDDIFGFYKGWLPELVRPLLNSEKVIIGSARLIKEDGSLSFMMGGKIEKRHEPIQEVERVKFNNYYRVTTACLAIRRNPILFDENFIGSGFEDTDYMNRINESYPNHKMVINNSCRLIHMNNKTNQGDFFFSKNKEYYMSKYPGDKATSLQNDWTKI